MAVWRKSRPPQGVRARCRISTIHACRPPTRKTVRLMTLPSLRAYLPRCPWFGPPFERGTWSRLTAISTTASSVGNGAVS